MTARTDSPIAAPARPIAIVMNMFYTGLGIARSLGEQGIAVIGLSAQRGIYGNYTRYADVRRCPDSREDPERLLDFFLKLSEELPGRAIVFPTRDNDAVFLDRFRAELSARFVPVLPSSGALEACLDKWQTYAWAQKAQVPVPRSWKLEQQDDLARVTPEVRFPCILKPISSHHWRKAGNWERVGACKAIAVYSPSQLREAYARIARADHRALLQEMIPGGDDRLLVAACYMDARSNLTASFTAQKLAQIPEGLGTGCIVQAVDRPEILPAAVRLLQAMRFTGIAEVEFKWDSAGEEYKLIEVNPRPWDQHRLGHASGVDLIHLAYCDLAGLAMPAVHPRPAVHKWVAEDVFLLSSLRSLWRRDGKMGSLWRLARGKKIYAIWSAKDPLPFVAYGVGFAAGMAGQLLRRFGSMLGRRILGKGSFQETGVL